MSFDKKLIECVPNFSEGKDKNKIAQIAEAIQSVQGVELLDIDMGADTNRTVITFIGEPQNIKEAAFLAIKKASELIDMRIHKGAHPRIGSTDVCPFVPIQNISMQECVDIAIQVAKRVGEELEIPVYLYEYAARTPERKNLANIRKGEYELLEQKLKEPNWKPDFGPQKFNAKNGATVIGAREFLIAYNINLNTTDKKAATDIAFELREKGRVARSPTSSPFYYKGDILYYQKEHFPCGNCDFIAKTFEQIVEHCSKEHNYDLKELLSEEIENFNQIIGQKVRKPGKFKYCKAIGWYVDEYKKAQISINLTNYKITPPHIVLEEARKLASQRGLIVTGSEVVGLIPYEAILEAGRFYLKSQHKSPYVPIQEIIQTAIISMGLNDVQSFDINKKIIGLPKYNKNSFLNLSITDFTDEVSKDTPAPGGGSISALCGALAGALASMVSNLSYNKLEDYNIKEKLLYIAEKSQNIKYQLLQNIDEDANAFNSYLDALRLPKNNEQEKTIREIKIQEGLKHAINIPLKTASLSLEVMNLALDVSQIGLEASITDAAVACQAAYVGVEGGVYNALINLKNISDTQYIEKIKNQCAELTQNAKVLLKQCKEYISKKLDIKIT